MKLIYKISNDSSDDDESEDDESMDAENIATNESPKSDENESGDQPMYDVDKSDDDDDDDVSDDDAVEYDGLDEDKENAMNPNLSLAKLTIKNVEKINLSLDNGVQKNVPKKPKTKGKPTGGSATATTTKNKLPTTKDMVFTAITELKERGGSSVAAILKFIKSKYAVEDEARNAKLVRKYIKMAAVSGNIVQIKRSFKVAPDILKEHKSKEKMLAKMSKTKEKEQAKEKVKKDKLKSKEAQKKKSTKDIGKMKVDVKANKNFEKPSKSQEKPKIVEKKPKVQKAKMDEAKIPDADGVVKDDKSSKAKPAKPKAKLKQRKSIGTLTMPPQHVKPTKNAVKKLVGRSKKAPQADDVDSVETMPVPQSVSTPKIVSTGKARKRN